MKPVTPRQHKVLVLRFHYVLVEHLGDAVLVHPRRCDKCGFETYSTEFPGRCFGCEFVARVA